MKVVCGRTHTDHRVFVCLFVLSCVFSSSVPPFPSLTLLNRPTPLLPVTAAAVTAAAAVAAAAGAWKTGGRGTGRGAGLCPPTTTPRRGRRGLAHPTTQVCGSLDSLAIHSRPAGLFAYIKVVLLLVLLPYIKMCAPGRAAGS